ncbi:MAG: hypothetical protein ACTSUC_09725 [Promethearchaeota archaeon]
MEKQKNLNGNEAVIANLRRTQPATWQVPVTDFIKLKVWRNKDSIWDTLKYFYLAEINQYGGITKNNLWKCHQRKRPLSNNSIKNNIKRLEINAFIKIRYNKFGYHNCEKLWKITEKGKYLFEEWEFSIRNKGVSRK